VHEFKSHLQTLVSQAHPRAVGVMYQEVPLIWKPTCLALLALSLEAQAYQPALEAGYATLARWATADGAYRRRRTGRSGLADRTCPFRTAADRRDPVQRLSEKRGLTPFQINKTVARY